MSANLNLVGGVYPPVPGSNVSLSAIMATLGYNTKPFSFAQMYEAKNMAALYNNAALPAPLSAPIGSFATPRAP